VIQIYRILPESKKIFLVPSPIIKNVGIAGHTGKRSGMKWVKVGTKIPPAAK